VATKAVPKVKPQDAPIILSSLARCAFLLWRAHEGDARALDNALDAAQEAVRVLKSVRCEEEWMAQVPPADPRRKKSRT
jgi:hypothetical protein